MYYMYVLQSIEKSNWRYIGATENLKVRFVKHNDGQVKSTKAYKPFRLIYYEAYQTLDLAMQREYQLKHHSQEKELLFKRIGLIR